MSNTCTLILVGVATPVSDILPLSITAKFLFIVNGHQKIELFGIGSKNLCKYELMSSSCTQILVGVASLVSEILLLSKMVKFPFPWSSKNSIIWNQLKKFMQVEVNVLCMHTNFDGCRHSGFRDIATFKNDQISLSDHGL